jgi:hypothetical protein
MKEKKGFVIALLLSLVGAVVGVLGFVLYRFFPKMKEFCGGMMEKCRSSKDMEKCCPPKKKKKKK